jgi:hypothetical protein
MAHYEAYPRLAPNVKERIGLRVGAKKNVNKRLTCPNGRTAAHMECHVAKAKSRFTNLF